MSPLLGIALAAAGLSLAAAFAYGLVMAWRRAMHDDAPLPLFGMIERHGTTSEGFEAVVSAENLALAARRCAFCGSKEQCRAWLASGQQDGYPTFCPNARFFEQVNGR